MLLKLIKGLSHLIRSNLLVTILLLLLLSGCESTNKNITKYDSHYIVYKVRSYRDTIEILKRLGYSEEDFKKGMKEIPRVLLTHISKRWRETSKKISVSVKKSIFLRLMASGAMIANEEVKRERVKLLPLIKRVKKAPISRQEAEWLRALAKKYKLLKSDSDLLTLEELDELIQRVDIIPVSLTVTQAAIESGWGTSRFALEGNALFGQWTWSKKGISPKNKDPDQSHKVLQFQILKASVRAYKNNLNTHNAYKEFRETRAKLRQENKRIIGLDLTKYLKNYAAIGEKYVVILEDIIENNSLTDFDKADLLPIKLKKGVAL